MMGVAHSEEYISGAKHNEIMKIKMAHWDFEVASGAMNSELYPELGYTKCIDGFAAAIPGDFNNTFKCRNVSCSPQWSNLCLYVSRWISTISAPTRALEVPSKGKHPHRGAGLQ